MSESFLNSLIILNIVLNFVFAQDCAIGLNFSSYNNDPTVLKTLNGNIKGACKQVSINDPDSGNINGNVLSWKAIPYAEPPIREFRFKKPVPVKSWNNLKNGTVFANRCMQSSMGPGGASAIPISEDCLYLNIFVRAESYLDYTFRNGPKKPIFVFIHGGRFIGGSGSDASLDPSVNVALTDIIYVTINYRLGPFGFMHLAKTDISGNQGFLDQSLALKWIYDNADKFGGDRERITLGGQSAGSFSASYHLIYPPSWKYFNSVILQSGTLLYVGMDLFTSDELSSRTKGVFNLLGCNYDVIKNNTEYLQCVQNLNATTILTATDNYSNNVILKNKKLASELNPTFQLVLDGYEFKETIKNAIRGGRFKKVNILAGYTSDEAVFQLAFSGYFGSMMSLSPNPVANLSFFTQFITEYFTYYPRYPILDNGTFANSVINEYSSNNITNNYFATLIQVLSELIFICPTIDLASVYAKTKNNVFLYSFEQMKSSSSFPSSYGVSHGDDIAYVFGQPLNSQPPSGPFGPSKYTENERKLSKQAITYWTNFVKTGNPNIGDLKAAFKYNYWPTYYNQNAFYNTPNTSFWSLVYDLFFGVFKFILPNFARAFENQHLIIKYNDTRISTSFTYMNANRKCEFWTKTGNL